MACREFGSTQALNRAKRQPQSHLRLSIGQPDRDCKLGSVKVHFVTDNVAILYGSESRIVKSGNGKEAPRYQAWTDTWITREGKWQVVAARDNVVPCKRK